jgi:plastocyanin
MFCLYACLALAATFASAAEPPLQPSQPSTRPAAAAGSPVRGHLECVASLLLQKPNLTRAVVYLASDPALDAAPIPAAPAVLGQHNRAFVPNFVVVPRGTMVEFPNWDHFDHNVFSRSAAAPAFDLERYPYGQSKSRRFDKVGVVQVFCNIHTSMRAMVVVTPNVYATRADADGRFEIANVPPGKYELVVWQERCDEHRQPIEVLAGRPAELPTITLHESRGSILANHAPDHRAAYGIERGLSTKREQLDLPVVVDCHPSPVPPPAQTTADASH